ncbi:hypothetical protein BHE74_00020323 [Ensete ventricosum]|nr:hypothetical protein GW17_00020064 [Ensete ventricosum]RWW71905.1 hypothetical protein BHE74_00020323 [Ensete ventricosum]RZS16551.1 hypothetical protein BHM03_00048553 [Ensete ventricosum]
MEEENGDFVDAEKENNHVAMEQLICAENSKEVGAEVSSVVSVGFGIIEQVALPLRNRVTTMKLEMLPDIVMKIRSKAFPGESTIFGMAELDSTENSGKAELGLETWASTEQDIHNIQPVVCQLLFLKSHKQEFRMQFQKHKYAKFKLFPCGKKGFELQLLQDASEGQFLIDSSCNSKSSKVILSVPGCI